MGLGGFTPKVQQRKITPKVQLGKITSNDLIYP